MTDEQLRKVEGLLVDLVECITSGVVDNDTAHAVADVAQALVSLETVRQSAQGGLRASE